MTNEDPIKPILDYYGWDSRQEMQQSDRYKSLLSENNGDEGETLRSLGMFNENKVMKNGWYISDFMVTDFQNGKPVELGKGPRVLLEDGRVFSFENPGGALGLERLTAVKVGPMDIEVDLLRGRRSIRTDDTAIQITPEEHDTKLKSVEEDCTGDWALERCQTLDTDTRRSVKRGVLLGEVGAFDPTFMFLRIGSYEQIAYFPAESENDTTSFYAEATDASGNLFEVHMDHEVVLPQFGLVPGQSSMSEVRNNLEDQPIFVGCSVEYLHRIAALEFDLEAIKRGEEVEPKWQLFGDLQEPLDQWPDAGEAANAIIDLHNADRLVPWPREGKTWTDDNVTGYQRQAADFRHLDKEDEDGNPLEPAISVDGAAVYDIREERPGVWGFYTTKIAADKLPKVDTIVGEETASGWIPGEGRFVEFLSLVGEAQVVDIYDRVAAGN